MAIDVPAIDVISTERNVIGNLVGAYNELVELMTLSSSGQISMRTQRYPLDAVSEAMDDLMRVGCAAAGSSLRASAGTLVEGRVRNVISAGIRNRCEIC